MKVQLLCETFGKNSTNLPVKLSVKYIHSNLNHHTEHIIQPTLVLTLVTPTCFLFPTYFTFPTSSTFLLLADFLYITYYIQYYTAYYTFLWVLLREQGLALGAYGMLHLLGIEPTTLESDPLALSFYLYRYSLQQA